MKKSTTKLGESALQVYRQLLLNKKAEFLVALGINFHRLTETAQATGTDPEQLLQEESVRVRLNRVLYGQLRQVQEALDRLDLGEYGYCQACGVPIAPKRLQAVPWTRYCLLCQEKTGSLPLPELIGVGGRI